MDSEAIMVFLQEHWYIVSLAAGVVLLLGAILNWNSAGAPHPHRHGRGTRRPIFKGRRFSTDRLGGG